MTEILQVVAVICSMKCDRMFGWKYEKNCKQAAIQCLQKKKYDHLTCIQAGLREWDE